MINSQSNLATLIAERKALAAAFNANPFDRTARESYHAAENAVIAAARFNIATLAVEA